MSQIYEHSKFLVNRLDNYHNRANIKGAFYLSFGTILIQSVIIVHTALHLEINSWTPLNVWLGIFFGVSLFSIGFTLAALNPWRNLGTAKSLIYYRSIARLKLIDFEKDFQGQTSPSIDKDLINEIYQLAKGLGKKFKWLRVATGCFIANFTLLLPILYFLSNK